VIKTFPGAKTSYMKPTMYNRPCWRNRNVWLYM
jgi:hypothetical protein